MVKCQRWFVMAQNSAQQELLPLICYFSTTVSSVSDKMHVKALGNYRFRSRCSSHTQPHCWEHWPRAGSVAVLGKRCWEWAPSKTPPWKPGEGGWSPKTPRRNPAWVCSIVRNFGIRGLMAALGPLLCGSVTNSRHEIWLLPLFLRVSGLRKLQASWLLSSRVE